MTLEIQPAEDWEEGAEGFFALSNEAYRNASGIAQSTLKRVMRSPQHTRRPWPATKAMGLGQLFHAALLEPETFGEGKSHVTEPATYTNDKGKILKWAYRSKKCQDWRDEQEAKGLPVISSDDAQAVLNMREAFETDPLGEKIMGAGHKEVAAFVKDPETGVMLKARMDLIAETKQDGIFIADPKTTEDGSLVEFGKTAWRFGYAIQNAFYCRIVSLITGLPAWEAERPLVKMAYATIETTDPHLIDWHKFDGFDLSVAEMEWRDALKKYLKAREKNDFIKINTIVMPRWQK